MEDMKLPKQAIRYRPHGKQHVGRLRKRWHQWRHNINSPWCEEEEKLFYLAVVTTFSSKYYFVEINFVGWDQHTMHPHKH